MIDGQLYEELKRRSGCAAFSIFEPESAKAPSRHGGDSDRKPRDVERVARRFQSQENLLRQRGEKDADRDKTPRLKRHHCRNRQDCREVEKLCKEKREQRNHAAILSRRRNAAQA